MSYRVVTFATNKSLYVKEAEEMVASLPEGVKSQVFHYDDLGDWASNTQLKPHCLWEACCMFPEDNIVWLDADARVEGPIPLFDDLEDMEVDIAHGYLSYKGVSETLSGTIWLRNQPHVRGLLVEWQRALAGSKRHDQLGLADAIKKAGHHIRSTHLPPEYCCIFDHPLHRGLANKSVVHYQKSRVMRRQRKIEAAWENRQSRKNRR
jgi:hypothetical protein